MSKKLSVIISLMLTFISSNSFSAVGEIKRIYPDSNGVVNFQLKGDSCNGPYKYYKFDGTTEAGKHWFSLLLASAATGRPVMVRVSSDIEDCDANINKEISYIYVDY